ncbi:MAG: crotonase/enoyl-CoA hydratase family protein [Dichotomicrobium sp.]
MRRPLHLVQGESNPASTIRFDREAFSKFSAEAIRFPRPPRSSDTAARQPELDFQEPGEARRAAAARLAARLQALDLRELELEYDPATRAVWGFQAPHERPSYTPQMLKDIQAVQRALRTFHRESPRDAALAARFTVLASRTSGVFNLGGDLQYFVSCVKAGDENALRDYAMSSIDICYRNYHACEAGMVTTALVCGDALGGGFEAALACDVIVAEEGARFALPEMSYGLFPGMGAYTFLSRRLGQARAERAILESPVFSARQLHDLELVNAIAEDGEGIVAMDRWLAWMSERFDAVFSVFEARRISHPVSRAEMEDIGERWVRLAMRLPEERLRKMATLAKAQRLRLRRQGTA